MSIEKINSNVVGKYKKVIDRMIKIKKYDFEEKIRDIIEKFLDNDLKNSKLSEEEYDILNEYLEEKFNNIEVMENKKEYNLKEELKVIKSRQSSINAITMYNGKIGRKPPKRFEDNER